MKTLLFVLLSILLLVSACAAPDGTQRVGAPRSGKDTTVVATETLRQAYGLLQEGYVEELDMPLVMAAGAEGMSDALVRAGVIGTRGEEIVGGASPMDWTQFSAYFSRMSDRSRSKLSPTALAHAAIRASVRKIGDCHTGFMSPQQFQDQQQRLQGQGAFGGIGVILRRPAEQEPLTIIEVFANGPASQAGLKRGDQLLMVDGENVRDLGIEEVVRLVRGVEGSPVQLQVRRAGVETPIGARVVRQRVQPPVAVGRLLPDAVGYVHIYSFPTNLVAELETILSDLDRQGARSLVIDLRDNSGGLLDVVTDVSSLFVPTDVLFQQVTRTGERQVFRSTRAVRGPPRPTVVLINGGTSSGGEILAGLMKEHGVGRLVGTRTAGCVSTGQIFGLPDGSALMMAVAHIITGRGQSFNRVGVMPNDDVELTPRDLSFDRDPQLDAARQILIGR